MAQNVIADGWDFSPDKLMTPAEVAKAFRADPRTVARWAREDMLVSIRTPGGHRRYSRQQVEHIMTGGARVEAADAAGDMDALIDATREDR